MEEKDLSLLAEKLERASDDIHDLKNIVSDATRQMTVINTYILGENGVMKRLDSLSGQMNGIATSIVKLETKEAMRSTVWGFVGGGAITILFKIIGVFFK